MAEDIRWSVLYTKQKYKKHKTYHDGILTVNRQKLILSDDAGEKLAEKFFHRHQLVECEATIEFDDYLVNVQDVLKREPAFASPSSNISSLRSKKETQGDKAGIQGRTTSSAIEHTPNPKVPRRWDVIYTKQKTKNLKTYHDGVLHLIYSSFDRRKVVLHDNEGNPITEKYLDRDEAINIVTSLVFPNGLVIGELTIDQSYVTGQGGSILDENEVWKGQRECMKVPINGKEQPSGPGGECAFEILGNPQSRPTKRSVVQIMSRMRKPPKPDGCKQVDSGGCSGQVCILESVHKQRQLPMHTVESNQRLIQGKKVVECEVEPTEKEFYGAEAYSSNFKLDADNQQLTSEVEHVGDANSNVTSDQFSLDINGGQHKVDVKCQQPSWKPTKSLHKSLVSSADHTKQRALHQAMVVFQPNAPPAITRQVVIPNEFSSLASYKKTMSSAMIEELNLILQDLSNRFFEARKMLSKVRGPRPSCKHGPTRLMLVKKAGANMGRFFFNCASKACGEFAWADTGFWETGEEHAEKLSQEELEEAFCCYGIDFYSDCEVFMRSTQCETNKKRKAYADDYKYAQERGAAKKPSPLLRLGRKTISNKHSRHDLWVISSSRTFSPETSDDFVSIAVSLYHGPSSSGVIELEILGEKPVFGDGRKVYAIHAQGISSEVAMLNIIRDLHPQSTPLLPLLLHPPTELHRPPVLDGSWRRASPPDTSLTVTVRQQLNAVLTKYQLNEDQAKVLLTVSRWFTSNTGKVGKGATLKPEICLVHGTFGSGKSFLLVVLIIFVANILQLCNDKTTRILVSAATNIAVDRILTGLLEEGFHDFMRVGSFNKIDRTILTGESADNEAHRDLQQLLKDAVGHERLRIEQELRALREGKMKERREKLKSIRVVGVTCHSCTKTVLEGQKFKVCLLDECAQIPEPLCLLPLCQFGCTTLVAVGDPAQLPPILHHGLGVGEHGNCDTGDLATEDKCAVPSPANDYDRSQKGYSSVGLERSLFVRLVEMGHEPILLRTQYRCHPRLAALPNSLFYQGQLVDGCRDSDRPPLVWGFPPLLFCDTGKEGIETKDSSNSFMNQFEVELASLVIHSIIGGGVSGCDIGVIVFYKAQASLLQQTLCPGRQAVSSMPRCSKRPNLRGKSLEAKDSMNVADSLADVQVSTVDAFQGMEKNIIILSCCRTNGVGFVASPHRLNVALTRARHHLIIIGKAANLQKDTLWAQLLRNVRSTPLSYKPASVLKTQLHTTPADKKSVPHVGAATPREAQEFLSALETCTSNLLPSLSGDHHDERETCVTTNSSFPVSESITEEASVGASGASQISLTIDEEVDGGEILTNVKSNTAVMEDIYLCSEEMERALEAVKFRTSGKGTNYTPSAITPTPTHTELNFYLAQWIEMSLSPSCGVLMPAAQNIKQSNLSNAVRKDSTLGVKFDESVRMGWSMMEDYLRRHYGKDCTNLRDLIEEYEDVENLSATEGGQLLLQLIKGDESGRQGLLKLPSINVSSTDVFDQFRDRLARIGSNLENLKKTYSGQQDGEDVVVCHDLALHIIKPSLVQVPTIDDAEGFTEKKEKLRTTLEVPLRHEVQNPDDELELQGLLNLPSINVSSTDVFDQFRDRLARVGSNLEDLKKTYSGQQDGEDVAVRHNFAVQIIKPSLVQVPTMDDAEGFTKKKAKLRTTLRVPLRHELKNPDDESGLQGLLKLPSINASSTDVFDQFRNRLGRVGSNLENLKKTYSGQQDGEDVAVCHNLALQIIKPSLVQVPTMDDAKGFTKKKAKLRTTFKVPLRHQVKNPDDDSVHRTDAPKYAIHCHRQAVGFNHPKRAKQGNPDGHTSEDNSQKQPTSKLCKEVGLEGRSARSSCQIGFTRQTGHSPMKQRKVATTGNSRSHARLWEQDGREISSEERGSHTSMLPTTDWAPTFTLGI